MRSRSLASRVSVFVALVAVLFALPFMAQPGSDMPQQSQDALDAQAVDESALYVDEGQDGVPEWFNQ